MSEKPKEGKPPPVVSIQQDVAHKILEKRLQHLLGLLHVDADLKLGAATGALLGTAADLTIRLKQYMDYPYKVVTMCRKWFPHTYRRAITSFLQSATGDLDVGFSLELQALALAQHDEPSQRAFMMDDNVQDLLEHAANVLLLHSLDAERKAAEAVTI